MALTHREFVAVVLAGGQSSRMKQDKALLMINNETMLSHISRLLSNIGATDVLISRNDQSPDSMPDVYPNFGPLSGVYSALLKTELPLLIVPVDMPLLDEEMLLNIVEGGCAMQSALHYEDNFLPLFLPNTKVAKRYLKKCLISDCDNKNNRSIKRFLIYIGSAQLRTNKAMKLVNTNTPEEWQKYQNIEQNLQGTNNES